MKKAIAKILACLCCFACTLSMGTGIYANAQNSAIPIDMYLLAGQSNAVGCSEIGNAYTQTFENIWYAGEIERKVTLKQTDGENGEGNEPQYEITAAQSLIQTFSDFRKSVSGGLGYHSTSIGPEYGMAKVFNGQYGGAERRAIIFKTAYGGTFLHNVSTSANWASPSTWRAGYKPDPDKPVTTSNMAGVLYQRFVDNFEHVYNELKANGYQPIVKGMAWMQGEADAGNATAKMFYYRNLKLFISDIREEIASITGDETLKQMPFVIGKIAKTYMKYNNPDAIVINEVQQAVADAEDMKNVYAVDTDDLIIVGEDKINGSGGWDIHHFNFKDMVALGERFASTFNEIDQKGGCAATNNATFLMVALCGLFSVTICIGVSKSGNKQNKEEESA